MQFVELDTMEIKYSTMEIIINLNKKFFIRENINNRKLDFIGIQETIKDNFSKYNFF